MLCSTQKIKTECLCDLKGENCSLPVCVFIYAFLCTCMLEFGTIAVVYFLPVQSGEDIFCVFACLLVRCSCLCLSVSCLCKTVRTDSVCLRVCLFVVRVFICMCFCECLYQLPCPSQSALIFVFAVFVSLSVSLGYGCVFFCVRVHVLGPCSCSS